MGGTVFLPHTTVVQLTITPDTHTEIGYVRDYSTHANANRSQKVSCTALATASPEVTAVFSRLLDADTISTLKRHLNAQKGVDLEEGC
ncbi:hypothetical protein BZA77DRAFT_360616 [Pyronema omphalodes]|nr:hypothetical protein BZA77DRAFT_360616 [Pyronema omphalodes]